MSAEPTTRELTLAQSIDAELLQIEHAGLDADAHSARVVEVLAKRLAAFKEELAGERAFVLGAAEKLLRDAGVTRVFLYPNVADVESGSHCCVNRTVALAFDGLFQDRVGDGR